MLPIFSTLSASSSMQLSQKYLPGDTCVYFPTSRISMAKEAIEHFQLGNGNLTLYGSSPEIVNRLSDIFEYFGAKKVESNFLPLEPGQQYPPHVYFSKQNNAHNKALGIGGYGPRGGHIGVEQNEGEFTLGAGYNQQSGWNVAGNLVWKFAQENDVYVDPLSWYAYRNPPQDMKLEQLPDGSLAITGDPRLREMPDIFIDSPVPGMQNGGSVTASAGYSQHGGFHASVGVSVSFAKENGDIVTTFIEEIPTKDGYLYLPSHTPGKFEHLKQCLYQGQTSLQ